MKSKYHFYMVNVFCFNFICRVIDESWTVTESTKAMEGTNASGKGMTEVETSSSPSMPRGGVGREGREDSREELKDKSTTLFVGNVPYHFKEQEIEELFLPFGKIVGLSVPYDARQDHNKG